MTRPGAVLQRHKGFESAQSMVEFALVLPILLLIIFGIIGFGHLFFTYSMVVSASRDAARFGAAVGLTDRYIPRYRDCVEIRETAVRTGALAGVQNTAASVQIEYDRGPTADGADSAPYPDGCPEGAMAVGPGYVGLGDRIVVTVSVPYETIVPLVNIPPFTMSAVSRRTIVVGMPVGDVPVAKPASACIGTITRIIPPTWKEGYVGSFSLVNEPVSFGMEVISDDPAVPAAGNLYLYLDDPTYTDATARCTGVGPIVNCAADISWAEIGDYVIRARFAPAPSTSPCFNTSRAEPVVHSVLPAMTTTTIVSHIQNPSYQDDEIEVVVEVTAEKAVSGYPEGPITVREGYNSTNTCTITLGEDHKVVDKPGTSRGSCKMKMTRLGFNSITAIYDEAEKLNNGTDVPYFFSSEATQHHSVEEKPEPTPTMVPTSTPGPTATVTLTPTYTATTNPYPYPAPDDTATPRPTATNEPVACPRINGPLSFSGNNISFGIQNPGKHPGGIASVSVSWPDMDPKGRLSQIYLNSTTIWSNQGETILPPSYTASVSSGAVVPGQSATMQIEFTDPTLTGQAYSVTVNFDNTGLNQSCPAISTSGQP